MASENNTEFRDFYALLDVKSTATWNEIKSAYRNAIRKYHPDINPNNPQAEEVTKQLNEAYAILSDPIRREAYDRKYQEYVNEKIKKNKTQPIKYELATQITLKQAYYGFEKIIPIPGGEIKVEIPAGIDTGDILYFRVPGGDLYLTVEVSSDQAIRRDGLDLFCDIPIDVFTAMLGGEVIVHLFDEEFVMGIPSGTSSDQPIRIRNKGLPSLDKPGQRGNLYLRLLIQVPKKLSGEKLRKVEELAEFFRKA